MKILIILLQIAFIVFDCYLIFRPGKNTLKTWLIYIATFLIFIVTLYIPVTVHTQTFSPHSYDEIGLARDKEQKEIYLFKGNKQIVHGKLTEKQANKQHKKDSVDVKTKQSILFGLKITTTKQFNDCTLYK